MSLEYSRSGRRPLHYRTAVDPRPRTFNQLAVMFRREYAVQFDRFDVLTVLRTVVGQHHSIASTCRRPRSARIHQLNT